MEFSRLLFCAAVLSLLRIAHSASTDEVDNLPEYMSGLDHRDELAQVLANLRLIQDDDKQMSEHVEENEKMVPNGRAIGSIKVELADMINNPLVVYRFLYDNHFDVNAALKALRSNLAWRTAWNYHEIVNEVNTIVEAHPVAPYEYFPSAGKVLPVIPQKLFLEHPGNGGNIVSFISCSKDYQPHHVLDLNQLIVFQVYMLAYQVQHIDAAHVASRSNPGADLQSTLQFALVVDPPNLNLNLLWFMAPVLTMAKRNFIGYLAKIVLNIKSPGMTYSVNGAFKLVKAEKLANKVVLSSLEQDKSEFWKKWIGEANYDAISSRTPFDISIITLEITESLANTRNAELTASGELLSKQLIDNLNKIAELIDAASSIKAADLIKAVEFIKAGDLIPATELIKAANFIKVDDLIKAADLIKADNLIKTFDLINSAAAVTFEDLETVLRIIRSSVKTSAMVEFLDAAKAITAKEFLTIARSIDKTVFLNGEQSTNLRIKYWKQLPKDTVIKMFHKLPNVTGVLNLINKFVLILEDDKWDEQSWSDSIKKVSPSAPIQKN